MTTSNPNSRNKSANTPSANTEMTREQALQVAWEALAALAKTGQVRMFNSKKGNLVLMIANARAMKVDGKLRLIDLTKSANTEPGVGTDKSTHKEEKPNEPKT